MRDRITARRYCACRESACAIARRMRTQERARKSVFQPTGVFICVRSPCARSIPTTMRCSSNWSSATTQALIVFSRDRRPVRHWPSPRALNEACGVRSVPPRQQIQFSPRMSRGDFLSVMRISDVMIDTLALERRQHDAGRAAASALPVVTLEGQIHARKANCRDAAHPRNRRIDCRRPGAICRAWPCESLATRRTAPNCLRVFAADCRSSSIDMSLIAALARAFEEIAGQ